MAFDTTYPNRKDWRQPYRDSRRHSMSCRNHHGCPWCEGNRSVRTQKLRESARDALVNDAELPSWPREAYDGGIFE